MSTDKRATPRVEVDATAMAQMLGASAETHGEPFAVKIVDASRQGMRLQAPTPMDAGQAVKVEMGEAMFLGEVCYCAVAAGNAEKTYNVGIVIEQCLTGLSSLRHLIQTLQAESAPALERV